MLNIVTGRTQDTRGWGRPTSQPPTPDFHKELKKHPPISILLVLGHIIKHTNVRRFSMRTPPPPSPTKHLHLLTYNMQTYKRLQFLTLQFNGYTNNHWIVPFSMKRVVTIKYISNNTFSTIQNHKKESSQNSFGSYYRLFWLRNFLSWIITSALRV